MDDATIVILAGGSATRFPGKLEFALDGIPLLVRVYKNAAATGLPVYVATREPLPPVLAREIDAPVLTDKRTGRGPLGALVDACETLSTRRVFAVAGDMPHVDADLLARIALAWEDGDEAAIPIHDDCSEPLAALYDREALAREGLTSLRTGRRSMKSAIERLRARYLAFPQEYFLNVNERADISA